MSFSKFAKLPFLTLLREYPLGLTRAMTISDASQVVLCLLILLVIWQATASLSLIGSTEVLIAVAISTLVLWPFARKRFWSRVFMLLLLSLFFGALLRLHEPNRNLSAGQLKSCITTNIGSKCRVEIEGRLDKEPRAMRQGELELSVRLSNTAYQRVLLRVRDLPWGLGTKPKAGEEFRCLASVTVLAPRGAARPWLLSFEAYLFRRGYVAQGRCRVETELSGLENHKLSFIESLVAKYEGSRSLPVLLASTLGRDEFLVEEDALLFKRTSTTHLLVVSGFHLAVIVGILRRFLFSFLSYFPWLIMLTPIEPVVGSISLLACSLFVLQVGGELPAVRALILGVMYLLSILSDRPLHHGRALGISFILTNCIWPASFFEASCQLTFAALIGLAFGLRWSKQISGGWLSQMFLVHLGPTLLTLPVVAFWFGLFVPLGILFNLLFAPIFSGWFLVTGAFVMFWQGLDLWGKDQLMGIFLQVSDSIMRVLEYFDALSRGSFLHAREIGPLAASFCLVLSFWAVIAAEWILAGSQRPTTRVIGSQVLSGSVPPS